jgi:hypothetical protein
MTASTKRLLWSILAFLWAGAYLCLNPSFPTRLKVILLWKEGVGTVVGAPVTCTYVEHRYRFDLHTELPCARAETLKGSSDRIDYHVPVRFRTPQGSLVEQEVRIVRYKPPPGEHVKIRYASDGSGLAAPPGPSLDFEWILVLITFFVAPLVAAWLLFRRGDSSADGPEPQWGSGSSPSPLLRRRVRPADGPEPQRGSGSSPPPNPAGPSTPHPFGRRGRS